MKYCTRCVLPDTRPNIELDAEGVCNACRSHAQRSHVNWIARERAFREVVEWAKARSRGYDCLIPVSGGKDSTWQVVKCLEYGLNPLTVTWKTPARTDIGAENLANLVAIGVDHIDYQVNPKVERRFLVAALERYGATGIPMHMGLFNIPLSIAVRFKIPLVVWGENSAVEYGGAGGDTDECRLDSRWLRRFGVTHGTTARDWIGDALSEKDLTPYFGPDDAEFEASGVVAAFLGSYFPWDPDTSLSVAKAHGFKARAEGPKTGLYDYADIDDDFISLHHFLKWYKFGFTRLFDNLALEIRNNRMTRDEAMAVIREKGDQTPHEDIERFCAFVGMSRQRFFDLVETYRNPGIWTRREGRWVIDGFLIADWEWT